MGLVVTQNPILMVGDEAGLSGDHPIIGWQNVLTPGGITSTSSATGYPPSNMANPATHLTWRAGAGGANFISLSVGSASVDYIAIARHNLGSNAVAIQPGYLVAPSTFVALGPEQLLPDNGPVLFRFTEQVIASGTLLLHLGASGTGAAQQIAVAYAGKLLVLPRKIYQGLAPINYARIAKVTNGKSEAGQFLGRIVLQEFVKNSIPLSLIDPAYFRNHMAAFLIDSKENPFFFAWRPQTYPHEIGYCHMTNDPLPINEAPHGLVAMQMEMTGVV